MEYLMPSKNSVAELKPIVGPILKNTRTAAPSKVGRTGRPPKHAAEKRDYKITLSLTQAEGAVVREKAGLAGAATYLYATLQQAGVFK